MTPRERLAFLAKRLREPLPEGVEFNIEAWHRKTHCGTAACAVGLAMMLPEMKADGLKTDPSHQRAGSFAPVFNGRRQWTAVEQFFGLSEAGALHLFSQGAYLMMPEDITPEVVADRIDKFLAQGTETG